MQIITITPQQVFQTETYRTLDAWRIVVWQNQREQYRVEGGTPQGLMMLSQRDLISVRGVYAISAENAAEIIKQELA